MSDKGAILVVDDTPASLKLLADTLTAEGYQVLPADSGELALASVAALPPELILLDIRMPGMDGFEVYRRLKAREESRDIPIMFISACGESAERVEGFKLGAVDFISKPFQREELLARVQTHLELRRLRVRLEHQANELRQANERIQSELAERKRAEEDLIFKNTVLSTQQETSLDGILLVDANDKIISSNRRFVDMWGIPFDMAESKSDELVPQSVMEQLANPGEFISKVKHLYAARDETSQEEITLKDDRTFDRYSAPMLGAGGKYYGRVWYFRDISERKRAAEALVASEARYRRLFESAKDGILILDAETGMIVDVNPFLSELLGFSHEEFLGKKVWDLGFFKDFISNQDKFAELQQKEYVRYEDKPLETADGRRKDVEFVSNVYQVNHHKVIQCNIRDNTERKRAAAALRASEQDFRSLAESMPQIVWVCRPDGRNIYFNQQWVDYTGLTLEQSYGHGWNTPFHPDDQKRAWDAWHNAAQNNGTYVLECRLRRADGEYRWWLIRGVPLRDASGAILKWLGTCTDIEDIKKAEAALADERTLLRTLVDLLPDAIYVKDRESRFILANVGCATKMRAASFKDLIGKTDADFYSAKNATDWRAEELRIMQGIPVANEDEVLVWPDGSKQVFQTTKVPLRNTNGKIIGLIGSGRDITELRAAYEAVRQLNIELEQRVQQRTALLEAANKELESFSYSVSHDLRAPLRGIDGWAQALAEEYGDKLGESGLQLLQRQRAASQRMGTLIDDLLQLSRLTRQPLTRQAVSPATLVRQVWEELRPAQPPQTAELVVGTLPDCQADPSLLTQVFANLLGNALKFSSGHPHPRIEAGSQAGPDNECVYFVKDNGAGFDMRYANKLFGAFQRLHSAHEFPGTGIGLAITQRIIHRHGGRIWAESAVGQGAAFYFTLKEGDEVQRFSGSAAAKHEN